MNSSSHSSALFSLAALLLTACGGGDSPNGGSTVNGFAIEGSGGCDPGCPSLSRGGTYSAELRMEGQKSAGVWFTASWGPIVILAPSATVFIDGLQVPAAGLTVDRDEIALVTGAGVQTLNGQNDPQDGIASEHLEIAHLLDGPLDALDLRHGVATVLGMSVYFDAQTRLDPSTLQVGMRVRVSGHPTAFGGAAATLIAQSNASGDYLVTNFISSIDPASMQLKIGRVSVDYTAAMLQGFSAGGPQVGDHVRVKGFLRGGTFVATSMVYISPHIPGSAGNLVSLLGIVTAVASPSEVSVDGYAVSVTDAAIQACGAPPQLGAAASLDGTSLSSGDILAADLCGTSLAVTNYKHLSITGSVDNIDPNFGTLSILGYDVQPSGATPLPTDIKAGAVVQGTGFPGAVTGVLMASFVAPVPGQTPTIDVYHGLVSYADPFIYVLGRPITIAQDATFSLPVAVTRDEFFRGPDANGITQEVNANCGDAYAYVIPVVRAADGSLTAHHVGYRILRC